MDCQNKRSKSHSGGPKWKKLKQESGKLIPGSKGLLISNSITGKYKEAMQEVLSILREHSEEFYPEDSHSPKPENIDRNDTDQLLKMELKELNEKFNRFVPGPCISKGLNYVRFKNLKDVPSKYVQEIFEEIRKNKRYSARFLSKMVPVDYVCNAYEEELEKILKGIISQEFPTNCVDSGDVLIEAEPSEDSSGKEEEALRNNNKDIEGQTESNGPGEGSRITWGLDFKRTNSNSLKRQQVLDLLNKLIGKEYKVDLRRPEKLIIVHVVKENNLKVPVEGEWMKCGDTGEDRKWLMHDSREWMYNTEENVYFHTKTSTILNNGAGWQGNKGSDREKIDTDYEEDPNFDKINLDPKKKTGFETLKEQPSQESEDFSLDFSKDIVAGTASYKGNTQSKLENEDRYILNECMSIQYVTDSEALCYFSGVFDGHYGSRCSEYIMRHVKNNVLTMFRQHLSSSSMNTNKRRGTKMENLKVNQFVYNNKIEKKTENEKDNEEDLSPEISTLLYSINKGIEMMDNNFISLAKANYFYDGSTLNMVFLFGPDSNNSLKLICANLGDSRAILCVSEKNKLVAKDLSRDHKPNSETEREYITKRGGFVQYLNNSWRLVLRKNNRNICGLSTSRGIGDYLLKTPNKILNNTVDLFLFDFDYDNFYFIVQCTDGILDVLTSQEVVSIVVSCIASGLEPKESAEKVVELAEKLGSVDDKTVNILYFKWNVAKIAVNPGCKLVDKIETNLNHVFDVGDLSSMIDLESETPEYGEVDDHFKDFEDNIF